jgi:putative addiction module CopG family antidote
VFCFPPRLAAIIRQKVDAGLYGNAEEGLNEAVRLLDERDRRRRLRAALAEGERGEGIRFTPELVAQMKRDAERMAEEGDEPNPDVCP